MIERQLFYIINRKSVKKPDFENLVKIREKPDYLRYRLSGLHSLV